MKLIIKTSTDENNFIISPVGFSLSEIHGLSIYIENLNGGYIENECIIIPLANTDTLELFHKIKKLFEDRLNYELINDTSSVSLLDDIENEEKKFKDFSYKALSIRNNNVNKEEFNNFISHLKSTSFKRNLQPYQLLSAYHLAFSQNACNFSVPGSGKTTTVLAAYSYLKNCQDMNKKVSKLIVIGPLSSFLAWKKEYYFCFKKKPIVLEIAGNINTTKIRSSLIRTNVNEDIILVSYGSVFRREELLKTFMQSNRCMLVLDEAHRIKNVDGGKQSIATLSLAPFAKSRIVLTGTPIPNNYADLYNLYKFIWPSHNLIGFSIPQLINMSKKIDDVRIGTLISNISPFFIRIKKSDLNLPKPIFNSPDLVKMSTIQQRIYDAIAKMAINKLSNNSLPNSFRKSALIRLRQAASNPSLLKKGLEDYYDLSDEENYSYPSLVNEIDVEDEISNLIQEYDTLEIPNKFIIARKKIEQILNLNEKVVVWCEFIGTCDNFSEFLKSFSIKNKILYGKTLPIEREKIIEEFTDTNNKSSFSVIIANPHAVGESISLHSTCHNAIYLEQGFNAGIYMQSKDRIHRVGLAKNDKITYHFIQSENTVDETVFNRVIEKENKMLQLIESQEIPLISENMDYDNNNEDDIKAIIRDYYEYRNREV